LVNILTPEQEKSAVGQTE